MENETPFYTSDELKGVGFSSVGKNHQISRLCRFYGVNGSIGNSVRIDDHCIFKGRINLGSYIHIAAFCVISGAGGTVTFRDFSAIACHSCVYSGSDSYSHDVLTNPMVPIKYRKEYLGDVILDRGALVGAHSILLPNTHMGKFSTCAAFSLIKNRIPDGAVLVNGEIKKYKNVELLDQQADEVLREAS